MRAELLIAWSDNTWTTEVHEVPGLRDSDPGAAAVAWAEAELLPQAKYGQAVLIAPFCVPVDEDDPRACPSYEHMKESYESCSPALPPFPTKAEFTCSTCRVIRGCPWAWDLYNTDGSCLATK